MAGKTMFEMAKEALQPYNKQTLHVSKLKLIIMQKLASSESGVRAYCRMLELSGITKEVSHLRFEIDFSRDTLESMKDPDQYRTEDEKDGAG